ncbi:MAG TPA: SH3 domain-containing protein, partial [Pyrinomonadaceae bacterium]|nr:SH3 domain-containing protein [Pyrinomonadaceae bacterium]
APTLHLTENARTVSTVTQDAVREIDAAAPDIPKPPPPPVAPEFPPTQRLDQSHHAADHARIVVPLSQTSYESALDAKQKIARAPQAPPPRHTPPIRRAENARRAVSPQHMLRSVLLPSLLLISLSGVLLATHTYFSRRHQRVTDVTRGGGGAADQLSDVGREALARTDINLRPDPSRNNKPIGLVEGNSRVRIIGVKGNWVQVEILRHGRDDYDPASADRGWVDQLYLEKL